MQVQSQLPRDVETIVDEHRHVTARLGARPRDGLGDGGGVRGELVVVALLVPHLDHTHPAQHRLVDDPRHRVAPAAQVGVGHQVEPPVDTGAAHASDTVTRPAISSGVNVYRASSHATAKLPGPAAVRPATVPAAPAWA